MAPGWITRHFRDFSGTVTKVARATGLSAEEAEEVLQDIFLSLQARAGDICLDSLRAGWFVSAARKASKARLRDTANRERLIASRKADLCLPRNDRTWEDLELSVVLQATLNEFPEPARCVLNLCLRCGWTAPETAALLGLSEAAVKGRLKRAKVKLRAALDDSVAQRRQA